jgi:hypothetical protein
MLPVAAGAILMVLAAAALTPDLLGRFAAGMDRTSLNPATLASRILGSDISRWSGATSMLTVVLGLVVMLFSVAASTVAATLPLMASYVPPGVAMLQIHQPDTPYLSQDTIAAFESDIGIGDPVLATSSLIIPGEGRVISFDSLKDLTQVAGPVTAEQQEVLLDGGVLNPVIVGKKQTVVLLPDDSTLGLAQIGYTPITGHRFRFTGFSLTSAFPAEFRGEASLTQWLIYTGLDPAQDAAARSWATDTGRTAVAVTAHYADAEFALPFGLGLSLAGFGLLFSPVIWLLLRREAISLRPVMASATSVGVPLKWGSRALRDMALAIIGTSAAISVLCSVAYLCLLNIVYRGEVFDIMSVPWWVLGMFLAGLLAGTVGGASLATRKLTHREASMLV